MKQPRRIALMLDIQWPYKRHAAVFAGTQRYASEVGNWHCSVDEYAHYTLSQAKAGDVPYDGIVARATQPLTAAARRLKVPLVNVWYSSPTRGVPSVFHDARAVGRIYGNHLLDRGFRQFGCLTNADDRSSRLQADEFRATVAAAGHECHATEIDSTARDTRQAWQKAQTHTRKWLEQLKPPVGVFVDTETVAREIIQACQNRGLKVPFDVAVVGGANNEILCEHPAPSLTSVEFGHEQIGYEAARLLDNLIDGEDPPAEPILLPPVGIVARESTDFFAVNDELVARALRFIAANSHESIGVDAVAEAVHTSRRTLEYRFKRHLRRPVAAEIRRLRIERAKRQLVQTDLPIFQIAADAGFGDTKQMDQVFRRELELSPSQYRRDHQRRSD